MSHQSSPTPATPYKGLMPYAEEDAPFFFGREPEREIIVANLMAWRLTLLYGPSGVGKSSLLHAGVAHHLRQIARQNLAETGTPEFAVVVFSAWRDDPLEGLIASVEEAVVHAPDFRSLQDFGSLDPTSRSLTQALQAATERLGGDLLIILDQFEEYFLYHPHEDGAGTFAGEFPRAVNRPDLRASFLIAIREDALAKLDRFKGRVPNLFDNYLRVEHLDREAARAAIEQPVEQYNRLRAPDAPSVRIEPALVEVVLDQVRTGQVVVGGAGRGAVGVGPAEAQIETPYLQLVMTRLWDEEMRAGSDVLRLETLNRLGGAEEIVERHLDAAMRALPPREQDAAVRIFHHLVTPSGTKIAHTVADLSEYAELPRAQLTPVLEKLAEPAVRILRPVAPPADRPEEPRYEIFHDVLAPAILDWRARAEGERELLRERRRVSRLRWGVVGLTFVLLAVIALAVFAFQQRAAAQREAAVNHSLVLAANAQQARDNGDVDLALALALEAVSIDQPPPEALRTLSAIALGPGTRAVFEGHSNDVKDVAFSPDSKIVLSGSCGELDPDGACVQGELILWDLEAGAELRRFEGHTDWVNGVAFSPDGRTALSGSGDGTLILWDVETGDIIRRLEGHTDGVSSVAFSPDGQTALSGSDDTTLILWNVATGEAIRRFEGHTGGVNSVAFSPDGQTALSGSDDTNIILWDAATGEAIRSFEGHTEQVFDLAFTPDGQTFLSTSDDMTLRLWNLEAGEEIRQRVFPSPPIRLVISPDGRTAVFNVDFELRLRDIEQWQESGRLLGHSESSPIQSVAISSDGRLALSGSADGALRLWNLAGQAELGRFQTDEMLFAVAVSPDGRRLLAGGATGDAVLWDIERGQVIRRLKGDGISIDPGGVAFSPDGRYALVASMDVFGGSGTTSLTLWDIETGKEIRRFEGHTTYVRSLAFSPDGRTALGGSQSLGGNPRGDLILWDIETGEQIRRFDTAEDITSIVFSADGSRALTGSAYFFNLVLWDVATGQEIRRFEGHEGPVFAVAFGPDEATVLSSSEDGSLILWDVETGVVIRRFLGHDRGVWRLDISPDGRYVISSAEDGAVILWDFETGEELRRFSGHTAWVPDVVFSPDGQTAFSVSLDGTLIQWQVADQPLDEVIEWVYANRYIRDLACDERAHYRVEPLCEE